jgi:hypothetical protein
MAGAVSGRVAPAGLGPRAAPPVLLWKGKGPLLNVEAARQASAFLTAHALRMTMKQFHGPADTIAHWADSRPGVAASMRAAPG